MRRRFSLLVLAFQTTHAVTVSCFYFIQKQNKIQ